MSSATNCIGSMLRFPNSVTKSRRKRQVRMKLDEVSRIVGTFFRTGVTDCAVITAEGDVLTGKGVSPRPFVSLIPKVYALRNNAAAVSSALSSHSSDVIRIRGISWMLAVYSLGPHSLVTFTPVPYQIRDAKLEELDKILTSSSDSPGVVSDLAALLQDI